MIAAVVTEYDDENVIEDCETGWKRFCSEVLVRTHYHLCDLCKRHRVMGRYGMQPSSRKDWEILRRQVAAYRWVFDGTGGDFTFDQTCADLGLDPVLVRRRLLSQARPRRDINLLVDWVVRQKEKPCAHRDPKDPCLVDAVRQFRAANAGRQGRRGAQTHAVCRYSTRKD